LYKNKSEKRLNLGPQTYGLPLIMKSGSGLDFIIKDLPSVLILIIADQIVNDSRRCC